MRVRVALYSAYCSWRNVGPERSKADRDVVGLQVRETAQDDAAEAEDAVDQLTLGGRERREGVVAAVHEPEAVEQHQAFHLASSVSRRGFRPVEAGVLTGPGGGRRRGVGACPRAVGAPVRRSGRGSAEASCREPQPEHRDPDDEQGQRADQQQVRWARGGKVLIGAGTGARQPGRHPCHLAPESPPAAIANRKRRAFLHDRVSGGCRSTGRDGPAAAQVELGPRVAAGPVPARQRPRRRCSRVDRHPPQRAPRPPEDARQEDGNQEPGHAHGGERGGNRARRGTRPWRTAGGSIEASCHAAGARPARARGGSLAVARAVRGSARVTEAMATRSRWASAQLSQLERAAPRLRRCRCSRDHRRRGRRSG